MIGKLKPIFENGCLPMLQGANPAHKDQNWLKKFLGRSSLCAELLITEIKHLERFLTLVMSEFNLLLSTLPY